jgi:hypothetical protein
VRQGSSLVVHARQIRVTSHVGRRRSAVAGEVVLTARWAQPPVLTSLAVGARGSSYWLGWLNDGLDR